MMNSLLSPEQALSFTKLYMTMPLIHLGLFLAGFIASLLIRNKKTTVLRRAPFFLLLGALGICSSLFSFYLLFVAFAVAYNALWLLFICTILSIFSLGYGFGALSAARSMHVYGHSKKAWFAIIPILNLVLVFKAGLDETCERSAKQGFKTTIIILIGILFFLTAAIIEYAGQVAIEASIARIYQNTGMK